MKKGTRELVSEIGKCTNSIFIGDKVDFCESGRFFKVRC